MLIWDPDHPGTAPAELGRHHDWVGAVAALPGGRVVTAGDDGRVLVWDADRPGTAPAGASTPVVQLTCSVTTLATASPGPAGSTLVIAHQGSGLALWSFTE